MANRHLARGVAEVVCRSVEAVTHLALCGERLDDAHAAEGFFKLRHGFAPLILGIHALALEFASDFSHRPTHQGQHNDGKEGEFPRCIDEYAEIAEQEDGVLNQHFERTRHGGFNLVDVTTHAGNDVALAFAREEGKGEGDDLVVHLRADVSHDARAHGHHNRHGSEVATRL